MSCDRPHPQVSLWLTRLPAIDAETRAWHQRMLSAAELARLSRFHVDGARDQFLVGRALLRTALAHHAGIAPHLWDFSYGAHGKPHVLAPQHAQGWRFNLSHTNGLVACAISHGWDLGVDVESSERDADHLILAAGLFAPTERIALDQLTAQRRRQHFYSLWTLKEAYVKARGVGFSVPLDTFWFDIDGGRPHIRFSQACGDGSSNWQFFLVNPTATHQLALAIAAPEQTTVSIATHWLPPGTQW